MRKTTLRILCSLIITAGAFASGGKEADAAQSGPRVVASSSWTAAFIRETGFNGDITVLAPADYRHPSEYELLPSQTVELLDADFFVYAGYEAVAKKIADGGLSTNGTGIRIATVNTSAVFGKSIPELAAYFGSGEKAAESVAALDAVVSRTARIFADSGLSELPVVCHLFLKDMAVEMGFNVVGTFGPAPPTPAALKALANASGALIIDNWHVDTGAAVSAVLPDTPRALCINFPGHAGTATLADVLVFNRKQILAAMER